MSGKTKNSSGNAATFDELVLMLEKFEETLPIFVIAKAQELLCLNGIRTFRVIAEGKVRAG